LENLPTGLLSHNLSDSKGFLVYHLLARTIGPDRFRKALHRLTEEHAFGSITWQDFTQAVKDAAGQDLGWFYEQWFTRTGAPVLSLDWKQEKDGLHCTIRQDEPAYRLTVPLFVKVEGHGSETHDVECRGRTTDVVLPAPARVTAVTLDPLYHIHHMTPALKAELTKNR
jgi:aminopeptidase N